MVGYNYIMLLRTFGIQNFFEIMPVMLSTGCVIGETRILSPKKYYI